MLFLKNKEIRKESSRGILMSLNIKHPEADRLARQLVNLTGESITEIVIEALSEKLQKEHGRMLAPNLKEELLEISHRCAAIKDLDKRSADEILNYDEHGLPGKDRNSR